MVFVNVCKLRMKLVIAYIKMYIAFATLKNVKILWEIIQKKNENPKLEPVVDYKIIYLLHKLL